jgi:hypothetical protein
MPRAAGISLRRTPSAVEYCAARYFTIACAVNFETSGTPTSVRVGVGDQVEKGQTLAKLDEDQARRQLDSANASWKLIFSAFSQPRRLRCLWVVHPTGAIPPTSAAHLR